MGHEQRVTIGWRVFRAGRIVVGVAAFFYLLLVCDAAWGTGQAALAPAWLTVLVIAFVATLIHEIGHALTALACGHRVILFAVRPFAWHVHNRYLALMPRGYEPGLGGMVVCLPDRLEAATTWRERAIFAGGPVASALLAGVGLAFGIPAATGYDAAPPAAFGQLDWGLLAYGLGTWSALLTVLSLLPSGKGHHSDGERLWALRKGIDLPRYLLSVLGAYGKYTVRLRDWPAWLLHEVATMPPTIEDFGTAIEQWEIGIELDAASVDASNARKMLDAFRAHHGDSEWLAACDAYFTAIWEADWRAAEAKLWRGESTWSDQALKSAAEAAVAARAGDKSATAGRLAEMKREIAKRSLFTDLTFRDIQSRIESTLAETYAATPVLSTA